MKTTPAICNQAFSRAQWLFILCAVLLLFEAGSRYWKNSRPQPKPASTNNVQALVNAVLSMQEMAAREQPPPPKTTPTNSQSNLVTAMPFPTNTRPAVQLSRPGFAARTGQTGRSGGGGSGGAAGGGAGNSGSQSVQGGKPDYVSATNHLQGNSRPVVPGVRIALP
jgi:hypothetical protein